MRKMQARVHRLSTPLSPRLSIVIPFLNEEAVLPLLWARIQSLPEASNWEFIFVSDGSTDRSVEIVSAWAAKDRAVKLVEFSRNFGHQAAISAGLGVAAGDFVAVMDADLQDEPEVLLSMFEVAVNEKYDVVYAVRGTRASSPLKHLCYRLFYRIFAFVAENPVQAGSGDFCVMSRRAVDLLSSLPEKLRFV